MKKTLSLLTNKKFKMEKPPNKPSFSTVKTSLKSIIKKEYIPKIQSIVNRCNCIVMDAYMFIKLYALYKYSKCEEIPELNSTFISYVIRTIGERDPRGAKCKDQTLLTELLEFYNTEFQPLSNHKKHDLRHLTYTLPYIITMMETCITTNLKEHFVKRLFRFVNTFAGKLLPSETKEEKKEKYKSLQHLKNAIIQGKTENIPEIFKEWYISHKDHLTPKITEEQKSIAYDCKVRPFLYLKYSFYMNEQYEKYNADNEEKIKLFQPLSLRKSNIPKYITFDCASLIVTMFTEDEKKGESMLKCKEQRHEVWSKYFDMDKKIFQRKDYVFNYTLQTDGVGCSLLFRHESIKDKKRGSSKEELVVVDNDIPHISSDNIEEIKSRKIVCADPGKYNLLYMMDENGKKLRYTSKQRDTESLAKRNRRITLRNKKENIINTETDLTDTLSTTVNYSKFQDFIRKKQIVNEKVRSFYEQELYRKLNWRTKTYRQRTTDRFVHRIGETFGKDSVLCIGDWSNPQGSCISGPSTMCVGLKRIISKKYKTYLLDEYNTSKKCCNCKQDIQQAKIEDKKLFRLLKCQNCMLGNIGSPEDEQKTMVSKCHFLTRDVNSCVNMLTIVKHMLENNGTRPIEFIRIKEDKLLPPQFATEEKESTSVVFNLHKC